MDHRVQARIRIDETDLADPSVDAALARQISFGMASAAPKLPDKKTSLLYRPWFALMISGALGGLAGWGIIEPFLDDGLRFDGRVEQVTREPMSSDSTLLRVGGVEVVAHPNLTRVLQNREPVSVDALRTATHVGIRGEQHGSTIYAYEVEILGDPAPAGAVSLTALHVRKMLIALAVFPVIAALVGLFVAAADGLLSRALRRAAVCALVGLASGLALGLVTSVLGELVYFSGRKVVEWMATESDTSLVAFLTQMVTRGLAWAVTGITMGLGQGIALRSKKMALNGLLGGTIGALVGGLMFDPIDHLLHRGTFGAGAEASRAIGFTVIGLTTGLMIGVVELLARDAWLKMLTGPLAGKEFVLFKNPTTIGSSPKSDIYLFKDAEVEPAHAVVHVLGEGYEIEDRNGSVSTYLNGRPVRRARLEHGDQVRIGKTVLSFGVKEG